MGEFEKTDHAFFHSRIERVLKIHEIAEHLAEPLVGRRDTKCLFKQGLRDGEIF